MSSLGLKKMRYPILWEKHQPTEDTVIDWTYTSYKLQQLQATGITPIAGLVHHGSGPAYINMADDAFATGLAAYAGKVAGQFPWLEYYTPVNEPLTTARFCGLYGIWHPHLKSSYHFAKILINECKGTVLAMQAIRKINPDAKLVQTDDLGKIHSTPMLKYQADFENHRRWLSFDLLCGYVTPAHPLWQHLIETGISENDLQFFTDNVCKPDIIGINHYLTSERYLDQRLNTYPKHTHGHNGQHQYADVEAVRVAHITPDGPYKLIKEACERYKGIPVAVTEVHLHCTREEQMRWLQEIWTAANRLQQEGYPVLAITAWAVLGSYGWNRLLTEPGGTYEPGLFDVATGIPRATVLSRMIQAYSKNSSFNHPVLNSDGWWKRSSRVIYRPGRSLRKKEVFLTPNVKPLLVIGCPGKLVSDITRACIMRGIEHEVIDDTAVQIERAINKLQPWAVINTYDYFEKSKPKSNLNAQKLAFSCRRRSIKLLTYTNSSITDYQQIFSLDTAANYSDKKVAISNPNALVIRVGHNDNWNRHQLIKATLESDQPSTGLLPDTSELVNISLNMLLDDEKGIWQIDYKGQINWSNYVYVSDLIRNAA